MSENSETGITTNSEQSQENEGNNQIYDVREDKDVSEVSKTNLTETEPIGTSGLATYDETIPDGMYDAYYIYHQDLKALSQSSDIIFTGRIVDYVETALVISRAESIGGVLDVYDGIVFSVDELIAGELPPNSKKTTMLVFALLTTPDSTPIVRISDSPVEVVRSGIEQRNLSDGPRYLVFGVKEDDTSSPFYKSNSYYFNTPGSVVQIIDDDSLGVGVGKPLNTVRKTVDENSEAVNELDLSDVRAAADIVNERDDNESNPSILDDLNGLLGDDSIPDDVPTNVN